MDGPAFKSQPQWAGCYCQFYLDDPAKIDPGTVTPERNRALACDRVNAGTMQGYLAFEGDQTVGWMAANRANNFVALPAEGQDVARVLCFVVDEAWQGKGVATALLEFAINDLGTRGFRTLQAAPLASGEFVSWGYRGPLSMFLKAGFETGPMVDEKHVLVQRNLTA